MAGLQLRLGYVMRVVYVGLDAYAAVPVTGRLANNTITPQKPQHPQQERAKINPSRPSRVNNLMSYLIILSFSSLHPVRIFEIQL